MTSGTINKTLFFPWLIRRAGIHDLISKKTVKKNINWPSVFRRHGHVELCIISVALEIYLVLESPDDGTKQRYLQL